jgi:hypothetical protein
MKEATNHGVEPNMDKMPQPIEPNEEQHQDPNRHPESFTRAVFPANMDSVLNHLGYLLSMTWICANPIMIGAPDGFLSLIQLFNPLVQDPGIQ